MIDPIRRRSTNFDLPCCAYSFPPGFVLLPVTLPRHLLGERIGARPPPAEEGDREAVLGEQALESSLDRRLRPSIPDTLEVLLGLKGRIATFKLELSIALEDENLEFSIDLGQVDGDETVAVVNGHDYLHLLNPGARAADADVSMNSLLA